MRLRFLLTNLLILLVWSNATAWTIHSDEQQALDKAAQRKFIDARRMADKALVHKPGIVARYVLSLVHSEAEGNLPRALFLIRQAKSLLLSVEDLNALSEHGRQWHRKLLSHELGILGHLDRRQEQLTVIDQYDAVHEPKLTERRIWPMVKLGQYAAARQLGMSLLTHEEGSVRQRAFNGLMAVEEEAGNRQASFDWGLKAIDAGSAKSCVIQTNTALGARRVFDFSRAIRIDLDALEAELKDCPTSPYAQLAPVYLLSGDFQKCVAALKSLRSEPRSRRMALQNEMLIRSRFVELLYALGAFEAAWARIEQIMNKPDRSGMVSYDMDLVEMGNLLIGYVVGQSRLNELNEMSSIRSLSDGWSIWLERMKLKLRLISIRRTIRKIAASGPHLLRVIRPYMYENMMWYSLPLADVLGGGVMEQGLSEALAQESDLSVKAAQILDAYRLEIAYNRGDFERVSSWGVGVVDALPNGTVLLKARLNAIVADALWHTGQGKIAANRFAQVMNTFPTSMRMSNVRLPVEVVYKGNVSAAAKDIIEESSRFRVVASSPFKLMAEHSSEGLEMCLQGNKRFGCQRHTPSNAERSLADDFDSFVRRAFAPPIELSQSDMSSLDGRAVQGDAQSVINDLLDPDGVTP